MSERSQNSDAKSPFCKKVDNTVDELLAGKLKMGHVIPLLVATPAGIWAAKIACDLTDKYIKPKNQRDIEERKRYKTPQQITDERAEKAMRDAAEIALKNVY